MPQGRTVMSSATVFPVRLGNTLKLPAGGHGIEVDAAWKRVAEVTLGYVSSEAIWLVF